MLKLLYRIKLYILVLLLALVYILQPVNAFASEPIEPWSSTSSLPYGIASHSSIALDNNIFILSGSNTATVPNETSAEIMADGYLSSWTINKQSPPIYWHSQINNNNFIYLLGGATQTPTKSSNSVYIANILANGTIGSWSLSPNSLPINSSVGGAVVSNNRMYYAGGFEEPGKPNIIFHDEIYFTDINTDGTIGSWQNAGTLPNGSRGFGLVEYNGYLIFFGGYNPDLGYSAKSYTAPINVDGTIGDWQEQQSLPDSLYRSMVLKINSTVLSIGGAGLDGTTLIPLDKVYYADLNSDGSIGDWKLSINRLPKPISSGSVSKTSDYLYLTGGYSNGYLNTVYISKIAGSSQPQSNTPIVIVPGYGGSWDTSDIITGGSGGSWKKTPFIKVYDNIKSTFIDNGGYIEGDDYFEFYYDWRQPTDDIAASLNSYIENILADKQVGTKVNLVGHSFGGLVSRTYGQKYGYDKINKLVTSGSPHEGAISAWQGWSGAEVGDRWSWQWIALQLYLQIHKNNYTSPVSAIQNLSPSLSNLTPIFDFAKDSDDQVINVTTMNSFNSYLDNLKTSIVAGLKDLMFNIAGNENSNEDSIEWVKLGDRSLADKLLGKWSDGKPTSFEYTDKGDLTVLDKSALVDGVSQEIVSASHVELMENSVGIQAILDALEITDFSPASGSNSPNRNPALIFFLHSPANIKVTAPNGAQAGYGVSSPMSNAIYSEVDKLLVIFDAIEGDYNLEVVGTGSGDYSLDIGQLTINGEKWSSTKDSINSGETDTYTLSFNTNNPKDFPLTDVTGKIQLNLAKNKLNELKDYINAQTFSTAYKRQLLRDIDKLIVMIDRAIGYIDANNYSRAYRYARAAMTGSYSLRMKVDKLGQRGRISDSIKAKIKAMSHEAGIFSMEGYIVTLDQSGKGPNQNQANREINVADKTKAKVESRISSNGENHALGQAFNLSQEMLSDSQTSISNGEFSRASAQALLSRLLSLESARIK